MDPFADTQDVATIWRPLTDAELVTVAGWIDVASQMVRDDVPDVDGLDVDERILAGSLNATTVRNVVAQMVRRIMRNPDGLQSTTEQTGPFAVTRSVSASSANSSAEMTITAREMNRLLGKRSKPQQAFTINTGGPVISRTTYPRGFYV